MNSQRSKILLGIAGGLALLSFIAFGLLLLFIQKEEGILTDAEDKLALAQAEQDTGVSINHLLTDTKDERAKIDSYFIGSDNVVSFIEQVESLSNIAKAAVSINTVGIDKNDSDTAFEHVLLNGTAEGPFSNVVWFLSLLESIPLQIDVTGVYLDQLPSGEKQTTTKWRLSFTLRALKLK